VDATPRPFCFIWKIPLFLLVLTTRIVSDGERELWMRSNGKSWKRSPFASLSKSGVCRMIRGGGRLWPGVGVISFAPLKFRAESRLGHLGGHALKPFPNGLDLSHYRTLHLKK
jgi:hypothetical protein